MSSEQQIERSMLAGKDREELHTIAGAVGVKSATRMRKADLIEAILVAANGAGDGASAAASSNGDETPKPRRAVRSARASELVDDPIAALAAEEDSLGGGDEEPEIVPAPRRTRTAATTTVATTEPSRTASTNGEHAASANGDSAAAATATTTTDDGTDTDKRTDTDRGTGGEESGSSSGPQIDPEDERQSFGDGNRRGRRRRRGRGGQEQGGNEPRQGEYQGDPIEVQGLLDLRDEGYGFLRGGGYLPANKDVYVSASQARRFALRKGDFVRGSSRPQASNEKYPALLRVDEINGMSPDEARVRPRFEDLTPLFPDSRLRLEMGDDPGEITGRIVDLVSPIGKGQRGLIVSPPKAGKTTILKQLVYAIERNNPEVHLMVLLVDERPEEVTDMRRHVIRGEVVASTFDRPSDEHTQVAELAIERAKRLVELGTDVVVILDGITRLARAYNLAAPTSGRVMSGGVDSSALYPPKKFFGAARNIEEGGSLTIVATALVDTGSRMDEVIFEEFKGTGNMELRLDRRLSERRIYPSIDVEASSTRHEELLFDRQQLQQVWKLRRVLNALEDGKGLELLIDKIRTTRSNDEFLAEIAKAPTPAAEIHVAVQAVVFDFYFTLVEPPPTDFVAVARALGSTASPEEVATARSAFLAARPAVTTTYAGTPPAFRSFWDEWVLTGEGIFGRLGVESGGEEYARQRRRAHAQAVLYPDTADAVVALRTDGIRLGVLSDADRGYLDECVARSGLEFDVVVTSEDVACYKPHTACFERVCGDLRVAPDEALFVGDSPVSDIEGARRAGLHAVWINRRRLVWPTDLAPPERAIDTLGDVASIARDSA